ncbi:MAG TPA: lamin tail domain-containing protein [Acidobacteriota bacterium]|nr:lamin tail domain-containing protein [Acidobacteriota bacterium]
MSTRAIPKGTDVTDRVFLLRRACWITAASLLAAAFAHAGYTVTGKFQYEDREFGMNGFTGRVTPRPIRYADVRIVANGQTLANGATGEDGSFSISVPATDSQQVSAVCITSSSQTPGLLLSVKVANDDFSFGDLYSISSAATFTPGSGTVYVGTTTATAAQDPGKFFNIWDVVIDAMQFVASPSANGSFPSQRLTVIWRSDHPDPDSFFVAAGPDTYLFVGAPAAYDDTVVSHEFGHFIDYVYSHSDSPGGQHFIGDNGQDMRLSWGEGLATFLGCSARKFHGYDRPEIYVDTDGDKLSFSFELEYLTGTAIIASTTGSTNEIAVSAALWDITDGADTRDSTPCIDDYPIQRPFSEVWRDLTRYFPTITKPGITIETFWNGWFSPIVGNGFLNDMQTAFAKVNGIEFLPDAQEPDDTPGVAPITVAAQFPILKSGGAGVVINELDLGTDDAVELYNTGDSEADISNWTLQATSVVNGSPARTTWQIPPFKIPPGGFVILSEASGTNTDYILYFNKDAIPGNNIPWANGFPGSCVIRDAAGTAVDFVRWGGSAEPIPAGTSFRAPDPVSPAAGKTLGRDFLGTDTDSGGDWTAQISTLGTYNLSGAERHHTYYPAADFDVAAFNAIAGRSYLIETLHLANGADTVVDILSTDGSTILASNDDYGTWKASRLAWVAPSSGRFYVRSHRFDGPSNLAQYGSYELRIMESTSSFGLRLPSTLTVSEPGQGGRFQSISDALAAVSNGDTVLILDSATYAENPVIANRSVTLRASSGKNPVLDGRNRPGSPALNIVSAKSVRIQGLTILGGARGIQVNGGNVTVIDSVITGASDPAGSSDGIQATGNASELAIINCTVVNSGRFGVEAQSSSSLRIANSIFRNNVTADIHSDGSATIIAVSNSLLLTAVYVGKNGNISGDPLFVDPGKGNYRLRAGSPAIDRGDPADPDLPAFDADGVPRSLDSSGSGRQIPDMGAYEYMPPGLLSSQTVFPQIAAGGSSGYRTSIYAVNPSAAAATVNIALMRSDATPFPTNVLDGSENLWLSAPPNGTSNRAVHGTSDLISGYASLLSSIPIGGSALFQTIPGDRIVSEAGVGAGKPARNFTVYIDTRNNAYSGYAVANYGTSAAVLTLTLRDSSGNTRDSRSITLSPGHQIAEFAFQRFAAASTDFEGTVEFAGDQPVAAVALRYDNVQQDTFTTVPVLVNEAAATLYFPQVADGSGYRTNLLLVNPSSTATTARLEFFADDGSQLSLPIGGTDTSRYDVSLNAKGAAHVITDGTSTVLRAGWVRITASSAVGGLSIFQTVAGGRITAEAGVAPSPPSIRSTTYVESLDYAASGLAICNPNPRQTTVTLRLHDSNGLIVGTTSFVLPPLGHVARFFSGPGQWFPSGFDQFQGTLEVIATDPVSGVALRYDNPESSVFAALPVVIAP